MPKKRKGQKRGSSGGYQQESYVSTSKKVVIPFSQYFRVTTSASATILDEALRPGLFTRTAAISLNYDFYQFTKLKLTLLPSSIQTDVGMGYSNGLYVTSAPSTIQDVINMPCSAINGAFQTVPTILNIPRKYLTSGPVRKFKVVAASSEPASVENQGNLVIKAAFAVSSSYGYVIDGVCEFYDPLTSGVSIAERHVAFQNLIRLEEELKGSDPEPVGSGCIPVFSPQPLTPPEPRVWYEDDSNSQASAVPLPSPARSLASATSHGVNNALTRGATVSRPTR